MRVFASYSERSAPLIRVWAESWALRGWNPKIISAKELDEVGPLKVSAKARGGGLLSDVLVINFGFPVRGRRACRAIRYGGRGWLQAPLVRFPAGTSEDTVRNCGRDLA